jgi:hypothetical protein
MASDSGWQFKKEVNLSMVVQLCLIASLVVGSWLNLEHRIDSLQRDVETLLKGQERFAGKVEQLGTEGVRHQYRLEVIERTLKKENRL